MIKDLTAFSKLSAVSYVTIDGSSGLKDLSGLNGLKYSDHLQSGINRVLCVETAV